MKRFIERLKKKLKRTPKVGSGISIIIPFKRSKEYLRQAENFEWMKRYWRCHLPGAQIIVGKDRCSPFSKASAINQAARRAKGDIFVIVDADGYIAVEAVLYCAEEIRRARECGYRLWYVPYRQFYRLTDAASRRVLKSWPCHPYTFPTPPDARDIQNCSGSGHGHWYGALIQILPREAFECVGGWDERFRGWGGEDHSAMRACDTLYWRHKTLPGQVLHLWHPMLGTDGTGAWIDWNKRLWDKQTVSGGNGHLAGRYSRANGNRKKMRALLDEGKNEPRPKRPNVLSHIATFLRR